jgi:hypothetical protein
MCDLQSNREFSMRIHNTFSFLLFLSAQASAQTAPVRLEPTARIGCVECDGPQLFSAIQSLSMGNGRIYVGDRTAPFIRVFDTSGRLVRAFGGQGNGPGELQLPIHVGIRKNGAIEVFDMRQLRFTRFDSTGTAGATRSVSGFAAVVVSAPNANETYLMTTDFRTQDQPLQRMADGSRETTPVTTLKADFPKLQPGEMARTPSIAMRPGGGFAVGDGVAEYRIRRFDAAGKSIGDIVREIPKVRKTAAEIEEEKARVQRNLTRMRAMARAEGGAPSEYTPKPERNHFNMDALQYDEQGRLWVRTERGGLNATVFDLFDPSGKYLGQLRVNARIGVYALSGGLLAAKVLDENEVEFVWVYRIIQ